MFSVNEIHSSAFGDSHENSTRNLSLYYFSIYDGIQNYRNSDLFKFRHESMNDFLHDFIRQKWNIFVPKSVFQVIFVFEEEQSWHNLLPQNP